jgi:hypothetical protein
MSIIKRVQLVCIEGKFAHSLILGMDKAGQIVATPVASKGIISPSSLDHTFVHKTGKKAVNGMAHNSQM